MSFIIIVDIFYIVSKLECYIFANVSIGTPWINGSLNKKIDIIKLKSHVMRSCISNEDVNKQWFYFKKLIIEATFIGMQNVINSTMAPN